MKSEKATPEEIQQNVEWQRKADRESRVIMGLFWLVVLVVIAVIGVAALYGLIRFAKWSWG